MTRKVLLLLLMMFIILSGCQYTLPWQKEAEAPVDDVPDYQPSAQDETPATPGDTSSVGIEMRPTVLYLADSSFEGVVHLPTEIPRVVGIAKSAVSHLVDDIANNHLISGTALKLPLPSSTRVLGATVKEDGLCKIDFSEELLNCSDADHERVAVDAIVYTLTEFATIERVQFMVEGEVIESMPHGTNISQPLQRKE